MLLGTLYFMAKKYANGNKPFAEIIVVLVLVVLYAIAIYGNIKEPLMENQNPSGTYSEAVGIMFVSELLGLIAWIRVFYNIVKK